MLKTKTLKEVHNNFCNYEINKAIETIPYTQPYHYATLKKAKRKQSELRKQGKKSHIICVTENGNDYILED